MLASQLAQTLVDLLIGDYNDLYVQLGLVLVPADEAVRGMQQPLSNISTPGL